MIITQFFGGPSSGKSTLAYKLAGELKSSGIVCELITEVAKDVTWEENFNQLKNQFFIVAKQFDRIRRVENKVDVVVMDAGLLQNIPYFKDERYKNQLSEIMINLHNSYNTINFFVHRLDGNYETKGRKESLQESTQIDDETLFLLKQNNVQFREISPLMHISLLRDMVIAELESDKKAWS